MRTNNNGKVIALRALAVLTFFLQCVQSACAAPFSYIASQGSAILSLRLPIKSVGTLGIPNGQLVLSENDVAIEAIPEGLFDSRVVLSGVVLNAAAKPSEKPSALGALVYFYSGPWLDNLGPKPVAEMIQTADGKIVSGRIIEGDNKSLSLRRSDGSALEIESSQITNIQSPRAFWLDIPLAKVQPTVGLGGSVLGEAYTASFQRTLAPNKQIALLRRTIVSPLGVERGLKNSSFAAYLATDIAMFVAPLIAIPLVFKNQYPGQQALVRDANQQAAIQGQQLQSLVDRFGP